MVTNVKLPAHSQRVLWGVGTARAMRAHWALRELRLDYRIEAVRTRTGDTETETFTRMINSAAPLINDDRPFLLGDRFSGVDIIMTTCLQWALSYDLALPQIFAIYLERLLARPAYSQAHFANTPS